MVTSSLVSLIPAFFFAWPQGSGGGFNKLDKESSQLQWLQGWMGDLTVIKWFTVGPVGRSWIYPVHGRSPFCQCSCMGLPKNGYHKIQWFKHHVPHSSCQNLGGFLRCLSKPFVLPFRGLQITLVAIHQGCYLGSGRLPSWCYPHWIGMFSVPGYHHLSY